MTDKKEQFEDDGRTIANMDVEGMPWYDRRQRREGQPPSDGRAQMTKEEQRMYTWAAIKAGLVIVLIFGAAFGLFIAFCDFVWFA